MATMTPDAETASCWNQDYWLRHCEGYRVWWEGEPIGRVEAVLHTERGEPHSLVVRVGSMLTHDLCVPADAVEGLDPEGERVFVALTPHGPDGRRCSSGSPPSRDVQSSATAIEK